MKKYAKRQFILFTLSLASLFLALIFIIAAFVYEPPPDRNIEKENIDFVENEEVNEIEDKQTELINSTYFYERINKALATPKVEPYQLSDLLYQFSTYLENEPDLDLKVQGHIYIAQTYLSFEEKIDDALTLALEETEKVKTLSNNENIKTEYEIDNLCMIATIYKHLGIKYVAQRNSYYEKAAECIDNLIRMDDFCKGDRYKDKLLDLVDIMLDLGDEKRAIDILKEWEKNNKDNGREFYFEHAFLLMAEEGNEEELRLVRDSLMDMEEAKDDFRYDGILSEIKKYLKED